MEKTKEKELAYIPVHLIEWNHLARMYGFSLDHPYTITIRKGRGFIKGVERKKAETEHSTEKVQANSSRSRKKIEIEEVE